MVTALTTSFNLPNAPEFPILNSTFYSKYIRPCINSDSFKLQNTSFKKLPNFINYLVEIELITTETDLNNHTFITSANMQHPLFNSENADPDSDNTRVEIPVHQEKITIETPNKSTPVLRSIYVATFHSAKILKTEKGKLFKPNEVYERLGIYLNENNLMISDDKCQPDPFLSHITGIKSSTTIKKLQDAFIDRMTKNYILDYCGLVRICRPFKVTKHPVLHIGTYVCDWSTLRLLFQNF